MVHKKVYLKQQQASGMLQIMCSNAIKNIFIREFFFIKKIKICDTPLVVKQNTLICLSGDSYF